MVLLREVEPQGQNRSISTILFCIIQEVIQTENKSKIFIPYTEKYIKDWFKYDDGDGRLYQRRMRGKDENGDSIWVKQYLDESKGVPLSTVWSDIKQVYADPRAYKENQSQYTELLRDFSGRTKTGSLC